jgi:regulator of protease activity HflC (stomatin/prohibitin superfamily)
MESLYWFIIVFTLISIPAFYIYTSLQSNKEHVENVVIDNMDMEMECSQINPKNLNFMQKMRRRWESFIVMTGLGKLFFLHVVPSEEAWVIDRHGVDRVACEGINTIVPGLDKVEATLDLREQESDPAPQTILTQDNISIVVDMFATFKIIKPMKAVKEVDNYEGKLKNLVETSTFSTLAKREFGDIQKNTASILTEIKALIEEDSLRWGIKLIQVRFENISPPQEIIDAEQKKIIAQKDKEAAILKAEGEHKVHELHADGERVLIEKRAAATAKAIKDLKELMPTLSDEKIMQFLTSNAYIDSMKDLSSSSNSKFVLYPADVQQPMEKVMNAEYMSRNVDTKN